MDGRQAASPRAVGFARRARALDDRRQTAFIAPVVAFRHEPVPSVCAISNRIEELR